jgi:DNA-binding HxlR family transcriptional regulator
LQVSLEKPQNKCVQFVFLIPVSSAKDSALDGEVQFLRKFACKHFNDVIFPDHSKNGERFYANKIGETDRDFFSLFQVVVEDAPINSTLVKQMRRHVQVALNEEKVWVLENPVTLHKFEDGRKFSEQIIKLSPHVNKLAKTLSNPKRTEIISSISQEKKRLSEIAKDCNISRQDCLTKLEDLQDKGLVVGQGFGIHRRYELSPLVHEILGLFSQAEQALVSVSLLKKLHENVTARNGKVFDPSKKEEVNKIIEQFSQQRLWERMPQSEQDFLLKVEESLFQT